MERLKGRKNDILLILTLLLVAGALWVVLRATRQAGGSVTVTVDGAQVAAFSLDQDRRWTWTGEAGSNTLVIADGAAYMESADCPDHICIRQGSIRYTGETIVCLPHRLVVTVTEGETSAIDAVSH